MAFAGRGGKVNQPHIPEKTLLEHGEVPLRELAAFAMREGRRPRAIYTAHKWFARRLATVFRALLIGAVSGPDDDFWRAYYGESSLRGAEGIGPLRGWWNISRRGEPPGCQYVRYRRRSHSVLSDTLLNCWQPRSPTSVTHWSSYSRVSVESCGRTIDSVRLTGRSTRFCTTSGFRSSRAPTAASISMLTRTTSLPTTGGSSGSSVPLAAQSRFVTRTTSRCAVAPAAYERLSKKRLLITERRRAPTVIIGKRSSRSVGEPARRRVGDSFAVEVLLQPDGGRPVPLDQRLFLPAGDEAVQRFEAASSALAERKVGGPPLPRRHNLPYRPLRLTADRLRVPPMDRAFQ